MTIIRYGFPVAHPPLLTFAQYQQSVLNERPGFALYGGVTGGQGATSPTIVTNTNDSGAGSLRAAVTGGSNRWIIFDRTVFPRNSEITINTLSYISPRALNNITIDGYGAQVKVAGWGFDWSDWQAPGSGGPINVCNNLIINNFKIVQAGTSNDGCLVFDGPDRVWVHHMDNSGAGDGNLRFSGTYAGPNANGFCTASRSYFHDSAGADAGKNILLGDETEDGNDYVQTSSSFTGANSGGGDNRITFVDCNFKDQLRNPVSFNYWIHLYNCYHHGWVYEGAAAFGGLTHQIHNNSVFDGTGAGANNYKGIFASYWGLYADHTREYKRVSESGNVYLGGATFDDESSGTLNPAGSIFTVPYSFSPEVVNADSGGALISRLTSSTLTNTGRAGVVVTDGYYARVLGTP